MTVLLVLFLIPSLAAETPPPVCPQIDCLPECLEFDSRGCPECNCTTPPPTCGGEVCPPGTECREVQLGYENPPPGKACDLITEERCVPPCPNEPCPIRCRWGLAHDADGCQLCECLPDPCQEKTCRDNEVCVQVIDESCQSVAFTPYKAVCKPICPNKPCPIRCRWGLAHDANGCQLCKCLPDPCQEKTCSDNEVCVQVIDESCQSRVACTPYKAVCQPKCKPVLCEMFCESGFQTDKNGCRICKCNNETCNGKVCRPGEECKEVQSGCENPPPGTACDPYLERKCVPKCQPVMCKIFCRNGFKTDEHGCEICKCKDLCNGKVCPPRTECRNVSSGCENPPPGTACDPIIVEKCMPKCKRVLCKLGCEYGFAVDANGCEICKCRSVLCDGNVCPPGTECKEVSRGCGDFENTCPKCCPVFVCARFCKYGNQKDENACQTCDCLPNPCAVTLCLTGSQCKVVPNEDCKAEDCDPFKGVCVANKRRDIA